MIKAAAIRTADGAVTSFPPPQRHIDIHRALTGARAPFPWIEGFITDTGDFLNRVEAMTHARACKQLAPRNQPADPLGTKPRISNKSELYSEDLW
jgi:hypothetical protein